MFLAWGFGIGFWCEFERGFLILIVTKAFDRLLTNKRFKACCIVSLLYFYKQSDKFL